MFREINAKKKMFYQEEIANVRRDQNKQANFVIQNGEHDDLNKQIFDLLEN